ncbi:MAG TPA: Nif3-like dinuclear metal center hexameric protein, partial [Actinomycetes bacterium]|nr:Nif3-like dinuclear metal center hexameric protein [Actinomycetes bacterium]
MTKSRSGVTVVDVLGVLDGLYPPQTAEDWDAVGLTCGDRSDPVRRVMFAVDPLPPVIDEALEWDADLLITHHPLLLRGVHSVAADTWKGRALQRLIRGDCALFTAHTNADVASGGVNDALAEALGLTDVEPLRPWPQGTTDKVVTFVPPSDAAKVIDAMAAAGGGTLGDYVRCAWSGTGTGTFTPQPGANPTIGSVGSAEVLDESRVEMLVPRQRRAAVLDALRSAHPYEEVAVDVYELAELPSDTGLGRTGSLSTGQTLGDFAQRVAAALPQTPAGVRVHGDLEQTIRRVAVCGGAGDSLLPDAVAAGVDAFMTADLRHHPASEHLASGGPALIDPGHWASEWPWLPASATALVEGLRAQGHDPTTVETRVSSLVTDPVSAWLPGEG